MSCYAITALPTHRAPYINIAVSVTPLYFRHIGRGCRRGATDCHARLCVVDQVCDEADDDEEDEDNEEDDDVALHFCGGVWRMFLCGCGCLYRCGLEGFCGKVLGSVSWELD